MLASAVGPSSQGVWKTKWSFAAIAANPQSRAASTVSCSRWSDSDSSPKRINGKLTPSSTRPCSQLLGGTIAAVVPTSAQGRDRTGVALATLVALAAILRFATIDVQSLWLDESATVVLLRRDLWDMLSTLPSAESSPPLYFVLAWAWAKLFGAGAIGLRSLSAVLGTLTVPVAYAAALPVSRRAGLWAAAIAAASPLTFYYAQEARGYALLILLCGLSFVLFQRALDDPRPRALGLWTGVSVLALLTHYFALFLLLPEVIWLARRHGPRALAPYVGAIAVVGLALLPLARRQRADNKSDWIEETSLASRIVQAPKQYLVGIDSPAEIAATAVAALLVVAAIALLVTRGSERERRTAERTAAVVAVALATPLVLSLSGAIDVFNGRNVVGAWVPAAAVVAIAIAAGRRAGAVVGGLLVALLLAVIVGVLADPTTQRDDWRAAAEALHGRGRSDHRRARERRRAAADLSARHPQAGDIRSGRVS